MAFSKEKAFEYLVKAKEGGRLAHAYLVHGPRGSGKRELAEAFCDLVGGGNLGGFKRSEVEVVEPESKSRRISVDQIRALEGRLTLRSGEAAKVGVIVDADRMNEASSNAFLKTLEEPPANTHLMMLTAQPEALLDTIVSRCIAIPLRAEGRRCLDENERRMAEILAGRLGKGMPSVGEALSLAAEIMALLGEIKSAITAQCEEERRLEAEHYGKTTESGAWLAGREDHYEAAIEGSYRRERAKVLGVVSQWWADALRHQQGGGIELEEWQEMTAWLAEEASSSQIIEMLASLDALQSMLERNVQEAIALESALMPR